MTSPDVEGVGSVGAEHTGANSVPCRTNQTGSVRIARAAVTDPHSVSLRDLTLPHLPHAPQPKCPTAPTTSQYGAASVSVTTWGTKSWIAQQGSCARPVGIAATSTF